MRRGTLCLCILTALVLTQRSDGAVIITARQVGPDVVFSGAGSINLADLEFRTTLTLPPGVAAGHDAPLLAMAAGKYFYFHGGGGVPHSIVKPIPFGSIEDFQTADSFSGDMLSLNTGGTNAVRRHAILGGAEHYNSGDPLSLQMTFAGETIESLSLFPGTYVWSWGAGANADTVTLHIVPEPSGTSAAIGLCLLGVIGRRRASRR